MFENISDKLFSYNLFDFATFRPLREKEICYFMTYVKFYQRNCLLCKLTHRMFGYGLLKLFLLTP